MSHNILIMQFPDSLLLLHVKLCTLLRFSAASLTILSLLLTSSLEILSAIFLLFRCYSTSALLFTFSPVGKSKMTAVRPPWWTTAPTKLSWSMSATVPFVAWLDDSATLHRKALLLVRITIIGREG